MKKVYILIVVLCILNGLDYITTMFALGSGASEGNAIAGFFIKHDALHWYKIVGVGLLSIYLIWSAKKDQKSKSRVTKLLYGANIVYGLIVTFNTAVYFFQNSML